MARKTPFESLQRLAADRRGSIAILFGLLAAPVVGATGVGIDYTRAISYRIQMEKAANAASLSAVDTARAIMMSDANAKREEVIAAAQERAQRVFAARAPVHFEAVMNAEIEVSRVGNTISATATFTSNVPTLFSNVVGMHSIGVQGGATVRGTLGSNAGTTGSDDPNIVLKENFTNGVGEFERAGNWGLRKDYNDWRTPSGAIEIGDIERAYKAERPPSGSTNALELDSNKNTGISRKIFLSSGKYDLRYWIRNRVPFTDFDPAWMCNNGTETIAIPGQANYGETNRVETYLDVALNDTAPSGLTPRTHNIIDVCIVTGGRWIERQFTITVRTPGFFWLTFEAKGKSDSYGSIITDILLCKDACKDEPVDNFPWEKNALLFSDSFETQTGSGVWSERTLDNSGTNHGWPRLPTGWTTWPENQIDYTKDWPKHGALRIGLDATLRTDYGSNRAISRRFVFTPGYYQLRYWYKSAGDLQLFMTSCGVADVQTQTNLLAALNTSKWPADTNLMRVYVDADASFSSPYSEPILRAIAQWRDPDGSAPTLPRLPATVIDACVYSQDWVERTVNFKISKAGFYWLTFRGEGTHDDWGAALDAFELYALGGLKTPVPNAVDVPFAGRLQTKIALPGLDIVGN